MQYSFKLHYEKASGELGGDLIRNYRLYTSVLDRRHQTYSQVFDQEALWEVAIWDIGSRWYDNIEMDQKEICF